MEEVRVGSFDAGGRASQTRIIWNCRAGSSLINCRAGLEFDQGRRDAPAPLGLSSLAAGRGGGTLPRMTDSVDGKQVAPALALLLTGFAAL